MRPHESLGYQVLRFVHLKVVEVERLELQTVRLRLDTLHIHYKCEFIFSDSMLAQILERLGMVVTMGIYFNHNILMHPIRQLVKVPTFMMCIKISTSSLRCLRVNLKQHCRRIGMAHEHQAQCFDTVVNMHPITKK